MFGCRGPSGWDRSGRGRGGASDHELRPYVCVESQSYRTTYSNRPRIDLPDVIHDLGTFRDLVPHVLIIAYDSMRHAEVGGWHPAEALLHAAADVGEVGKVI